MKLKVFAIPAVGDESAEEALNLFLAQHRVAQIDRQLIQNGSASYWSVCVWYFEGGAAVAHNRKAAKVDYKEVLSAEHFRHYAALREWRKQVAEGEGIPVFGLFTNDQMAKMVQLPKLTISAFSGIEGIGQEICELQV